MADFYHGCAEILIIEKFSLSLLHDFEGSIAGPAPKLKTRFIVIILSLRLLEGSHLDDIINCCDRCER